MTPALAVLEGLPDPTRAERFETSEHVATAAQPSTRPTRSSRNQDLDYIEGSPKRSKQLRRLRGIKTEMCKLAIGPSQQYEGGEELFLDQEVCSQGTIICYFPWRNIMGAEAEASSSTYIMCTQIGP